MKTCIITLLLSIWCNSTFSQKRIVDPVADFVSDFKRDTSFKRTIHKIIFDFNGDGRKDIALSQSSSWGNAGGSWDFYFRKPDGSYFYFDRIETLHPLAYSVLRQKNKPPVIMVYLRSNCCSGGIANYQIGRKGFWVKTGPSFGIKTKLSGEEVAAAAGKVLGKGRKGDYFFTDVGCLARNKKGCWLPAD